MHLKYLGHQELLETSLVLAAWQTWSGKQMIEFVLAAQYVAEAKSWIGIAQNAWAEF